MGTTQAQRPHRGEPRDGWVVVSCVVVAATALLVLLGWTLGVEALKRLGPSWVAMNPATALLFLIASAALWLQRPGVAAAAAGNALRIARVLAIVVAAVGALKLGEHLGGWSVGMDRWLFSDRLAGEGRFARNEMAPNTATGFLLLGSALAALDAGSRSGPRPAEWLAAAVGLLALVVALGYAYRIEAMYGIARYIPMALPTALLFLLMASGVLLSRPQAGIAALFVGNRTGSRVARRLLAGSLLIVAGMGWLRLEGERAGLYGSELGVTIYTTGVAVLLALLVIGSARALQRAEAARDAALALNRLVMDNSLDVICVVDAAGRFVQVSAAAKQLWGYAPEELAGRRYAELVHPEDVEKTQAAAASILSGRPVADFSNRYLRRDGGTIEIDWSAIWSVRDRLMFCVARDATRRRQSEDLLREREAQTRAIIDTASDAFVAIDRFGVVIEWNSSAERIFGWSRKHALGRRLSETIIPPRHRVAHDMGLDRYLATGEGPILNRAVEMDALHRNGHEFPVELTIWAVSSGSSATFNAFLRDISQRRRSGERIHALNAELQQTNRELEAFSYTISHDLRAPLRHIDGYARMLLEDAGDHLGGDARRYLDEIGGAARHMGSLIDDLLAFSRMGRKALERVPVDMAELVQRVAQEAGAASDGRIRFEPMPPASADPVLLKQVWVNLLSNALKYSAPRGKDARIVVGGERDGDVLRYWIRDNGVGFDMRYSDKLFGVFQRLHADDEFEGTGVGLAIVQRIVSRHGGEIHASSQVGKGATFAFVLPLATEDAGLVEETETEDGT